MFEEKELHITEGKKFHPLKLDPIPRGEASPEIPSFIKGFTKRDPSGMKGNDLEGMKQKEAKKIIEEAKLKAELIEKEAYEKAYVLGERAGKEMGLRKFQSLFNALEKAKVELDRLREEVIKRSESDLIRLSLAICKKVIAEEVEVNEGIVVKNIKSGIRSLLHPTTVKVKVHPSDLEKVIQCREEIRAEREELKELIFEGDERIGKGGAILETPFGEADCRIERRMNGIEDLFMKILRQKEASS